jgi:hypothetical protein
MRISVYATSSLVEARLEAHAGTNCIGVPIIHKLKLYSFSHTLFIIATILVAFTFSGVIIFGLFCEGAGGGSDGGFEWMGMAHTRAFMTHPHYWHAPFGIPAIITHMPVHSPLLYRGRLCVFLPLDEPITHANSTTRANSTT